MAEKQIIALAAPVTISAADPEKKGPRTFSSTFYTGGALSIEGWNHPVVVDLATLKPGNVLVANLDHDKSKRVGNFEVHNDGKSLIANGKATARTAARDEVIGSADEGYQWQSSLEVNPGKVELMKDGKAFQANGQSFTGPMFLATNGTLKGFGFVSHGADDNTTVTIAASAASKKGNAMDAACTTWIEGLGLNVEELNETQLKNLEADYKGRQGKRSKVVAAEPANPFEKMRNENNRITEINAIAQKRLEAMKAHGAGMLPQKTIDDIERVVAHAIETEMSVAEFRAELAEMQIPQGHTVFARPEHGRLTDRILQAAVCQAGRLPDIEKAFSPEELQAAHDQFKGRIGLKQLFLEAAYENGYRGRSFEVTADTLRAAFPQQSQIQATGFSTIVLTSTLGNIANKFIRVGWNAIDMTPMRVAFIRTVTNFQQITTVSLTGDLQYEKLGSDGMIKHGTLGETTYTNQADTYAKMCAITRKDIINDDLGALTQVPNRLGRGAALKLNDIFWTAFLNNGSFFTSGNANVNTGVANMTVGGLDATETVFMNQTDPDGKPLGVTARILLVPPALKNSAITLMASQQAVYATSTQTSGVNNPFAGRFTVESSPYMANSSYTGYDAAAWYMLADPNELPVIEIAALFGRVEPTVETADVDFNQLGVQMRGYTDIGCSLQEKRGGVRADGGSS